MVLHLKILFTAFLLGMTVFRKSLDSLSTNGTRKA